MKDTGDVFDHVFQRPQRTRNSQPKERNENDQKSEHSS